MECSSQGSSSSGSETGNVISAEEATSQSDSKQTKKINKKQSYARFNNQLLRKRGEAYIGFSKIDGAVVPVVRPAVDIKPRCNGCLQHAKSRLCVQVSDQERLKIFKYFWSLDKQEKITFVRQRVRVTHPRRRVKRDTDLTQRVQRLYHLGGLQVCRTMFLNTLGMRDKTIAAWTSSELLPAEPDVPVKYVESKKEEKKHLREFCESLPISHCSGATKYVEAAFTSIQDIFR